MSRFPRPTRPPNPSLQLNPLAAALAAGLFAVPAAPGFAATLAVDGTTCTLANAVAAANTDTLTGGCPAGSGADIITLVSGSTHALTESLVVNSGIVIQGNGSTVTRNPVTAFVVNFSVNAGGNLSLEKLSLTGGTGGALLVGGGATLSLKESTVSGNTAAGKGGGIRNYGILNIVNSTVSGNSSGSSGGGVFNYAILTMVNSTVTGNSAASGAGGGVYNSKYGRATLSNTVISGNTASLGREVFNDRYQYGGGPPKYGIITSNNSLFGHSGSSGIQTVQGFNSGTGSNVVGPAATLTSILNTSLANNGGLNRPGF